MRKVGRAGGNKGRRIVAIVAAAAVCWLCCRGIGPSGLLRAAGDARFTMVTSMVSMWVFRIGMSYVLGAWLGMGLFGVWTAMQIDWAVRSLVFGVRFLGHKWEKARVLEG